MRSFHGNVKMELIRLFMRILLLICLILSINFKGLDKIYKENLRFKETVESSSPLGVNVVDFKGKVKIVEVLDYTPAKNAGLEPGDRILQVNGCKVCNVKAFFENIEQLKADEPVNLIVYRVDSRSTFPVDVLPFTADCK